MSYRKGDAIEVSCDGRTVDGLVVLASPNSQSLFIAFDAMFGGHAGMMPVTMRDETHGFSIIDGTEISIRKACQ